MKMENFDPFCEIHSFTYESVFRGTILLQPERLHLGISPKGIFPMRPDRAYSQITTCSICLDFSILLCRRSYLKFWLQT